MLQLTYDDISSTTTFIDGYQPNEISFPNPSAVRARNCGNEFGTVSFPDLSLFVEYGPPYKVSIDEARTLQALGRAFPNGEVPVPWFYGWRCEEGINIIYMSLIPGDTLEGVWETLLESEKERIASQLWEAIDCLRSFQPRTSESFIGSISGGRVQDIWFRDDTGAGPFQTVKAFNDRMQYWALDWLPMSQRPPDSWRAFLPDSSSVCFTHADLHLQNILVSGESGERQLSGTVDWGQAGWYPEWWEYCKALLLTGHHGWYKEGWLRRVMRAYDKEYEGFGEYWDCKPP